MIVIREAYRKAGRVWNWEGDPIGVGINIEHFAGEGDIYFRIQDLNTMFKVSKMKVRKFIKAYHSIEKIGKTILWVFPLRVCESDKIQTYTQ